MRTKAITSTLLALMVVAPAGCDKKAADSEKATKKADAEKADAEKADAEQANAEKTPAPDTKADPPAAPSDAAPAVVAEADYAKGIVGTWKQLSQTLVSGGGAPIELPTPEGMEMFLEFKADGGYVNRGTVQGKEHKTESTYKVEGASFQIGNNEKVEIKSMTGTTLETVVKNDAGSSTTKYERVPG